MTNRGPVNCRAVAVAELVPICWAVPELFYPGPVFSATGAGSFLPSPFSSSQTRLFIKPSPQLNPQPFHLRWKPFPSEANSAKTHTSETPLVTTDSRSCGSRATAKTVTDNLFHARPATSAVFPPELNHRQPPRQQETAPSTHRDFVLDISNCNQQLRSPRRACCLSRSSPKTNPPRFDTVHRSCLCISTTKFPSTDTPILPSSYSSFVIHGSLVAPTTVQTVERLHHKI